MKEEEVVAKMRLQIVKEEEEKEEEEKEEEEKEEEEKEEEEKEEEEKEEEEKEEEEKEEEEKEEEEKEEGEEGPREKKFSSRFPFRLKKIFQRSSSKNLLSLCVCESEFYSKFKAL
jgi:hypothetical protein